MAEPHRGIVGPSDRHRCPASSRQCLYELALRQAIASQHRIDAPGRLSLSSCEECGAPYLLQEVWQPLSEEGELACPRCGAVMVSWDGSRSYVAYWLKGGQPIGSR
jgi:hypothetical protein